MHYLQLSQELRSFQKKEAAKHGPIFAGTVANGYLV
jgi:hypothetical protein